ncbi:MAG: ZIP family metal transporter [Bacteroidetes bacterium]|nr:ZIP family metal transporter [Bacteroidota bacterium]
MLSNLQWIFLASILFITIGGGYAPLFGKKSRAGQLGFPRGEAFAAGVFLALSLTIMLPSGLHLLSVSFPKFNFPLASLIAITTFLVLLGMEQFTTHLKNSREITKDTPPPGIIPIIMTIMIAIPSFFLGTALGIGKVQTELFIFIAIIMHKGTAAFALTLKMVNSTLTRTQTLITFSLFAFATPFGIFIGADAQQYLTSDTMVLIKGIILSLASGTFLYMATLHDLDHTALIKNCRDKRGYLMILLGFIITALVRFLLGEAHHL